MPIGSIGTQYATSVVGKVLVVRAGMLHAVGS